MTHTFASKDRMLEIASMLDISASVWEGGSNWAAEIRAYVAAHEPPAEPIAWRRLIDSPYTLKPEWHYTHQQPTISPEKWKPVYSRASQPPEAGCVSIPLDIAKIIDSAFLPNNPNRLRNAHRDTVIAAHRFKDAVRTALTKEVKP